MRSFVHFLTAQHHKRPAGKHAYTSRSQHDQAATNGFIGLRRT